jgi:hypothetical protein
MPPQNKIGTLQAYVMQKRTAAKKPMDILSCTSKGETYHQNYSLDYYNYVIFMVTKSRQDKHEPLIRKAHSLVISDHMCNEFHYVSLMQNECGGYITAAIILRLWKAVPWVLGIMAFKASIPVPAIVFPTTMGQPSQRASC